MHLQTESLPLMSCISYRNYLLKMQIILPSTKLIAIIHVCSLSFLFGVRILASSIVHFRTYSISSSIHCVHTQKHLATTCHNPNITIHMWLESNQVVSTEVLGDMFKCPRIPMAWWQFHSLRFKCQYYKCRCCLNLLSYSLGNYNLCYKGIMQSHLSDVLLCLNVLGDIKFCRWHLREI